MWSAFGTSKYAEGDMSMKKLASVSLLAMALLLVAVVPSHARSGFHRGGSVRARVFVGVGPGWWGPGYWGPGYWGPPYGYYPPPYYVTPPPVVIQQPPVYVEQPAPPAPAQPAPPTAYWYYCSSAGAYYPSVGTCPEPWVKVAPRPQ